MSPKGAKGAGRYDGPAGVGEVAGDEADAYGFNGDEGRLWPITKGVHSIEPGSLNLHAMSNAMTNVELTARPISQNAVT